MFFVRFFDIFLRYLDSNSVGIDLIAGKIYVGAVATEINLYKY